MIVAVFEKSVRSLAPINEIGGGANLQSYIINIAFNKRTAEGSYELMKMAECDDVLLSLMCDISGT